MPQRARKAERVGGIPRDEEARVAAWLEGEGALATLVGAPGIGKSWLARRAAARARSETARSVVWVGLRGATGGEPLHRLARATDVARADLASVVRALRQRVDLVVLDDCDEVLVELAELAASILERAPMLRLLVTAREPLGLEGESILVVDGFGAPRPGEPLGASRAGALLLAEARAIEPGWSLDREDEAALRTLLEQLGDVPLAIRIAAPHVVQLGAAALVPWLDQPLNLLSGPSTDAQRSQRQMLAASLARLPEDARRVLAHATELERPFDVEDVALVCGRTALSIVRLLRERSWLVSPERGAYDLLAPLRQLVRELVVLEDGQVARAAEAVLRGALRGRHSPAHVVERAIRLAVADPSLRPLVAPALEASFTSLAAAGSAERLARLASELAPALDDDAQSTMLRVQGRAAVETGHFEEARASLDALAAREDASRDARLLSARLDFRVGRYEALAAIEPDLRPDRAEDVELFATAASIRGERALALAIYERALARGVPESEPALRAMRARLLVETGSSAAALVEVERAHACGVNDRRVEASLAATRALAYHEEQRLNLAIVEYDAAVASYAGMGNVLASYLRFVRAMATLEAGRSVEACACFLAALEDVPPGMSQLAPLCALARWVAFAEPPPAPERDDSVVDGSLAMVEAYAARVDGRASGAQVDAVVGAQSQRASWSVVSRILARLARSGPIPNRGAAPSAPVLIVGPSASWFALRGAAQVSLLSRPVLARVLAHLVLRAEQRSGPASIEDIAGAAWPAERMLARAKRGRVHVAIATLRRMGLREQITSVATGYRLEASIRRAGD